MRDSQHFRPPKPPWWFFAWVNPRKKRFISKDLVFGNNPLVESFVSFFKIAYAFSSAYVIGLAKIQAVSNRKVICFSQARRLKR